MYPTDSGTLSFEGSAGQLFSITNNLTGTIFSVNDVSGIPSIEVLDTGTVRFAQYNGNVGIGIDTANAKLHVAGSALFTGSTNLGATSYITNTTSGSGAIPGEQIFRLAANGAAIGPTIADFFGATSSIALEASSVYEITAYCVFLKTTASTVTWTLLASSAPTRMAGTYVSSPNAGITAGVINSGFAGSQAATTAAFLATNSLTTAVNHVFQFKIQIQTNAATNWRLQITSANGTVTPQAGSYYTVKKLASTTGTFVA
jgi:hypothetical protein